IPETLRLIDSTVVDEICILTDAGKPARNGREPVVLRPKQQRSENGRYRPRSGCEAGLGDGGQPAAGPHRTIVVAVREARIPDLLHSRREQSYGHATARKGCRRGSI